MKYCNSANNFILKNSFTHQAFYLFLFLSLFNLASCQDGNNKILKGSKTMEPKHTNSLINETSPYLLQHAHNPVDWMAWNNEAFEKSKEREQISPHKYRLFGLPLVPRDGT